MVFSCTVRKNSIENQHEHDIGIRSYT